MGNYSCQSGFNQPKAFYLTELPPVFFSSGLSASLVQFSPPSTLANIDRDQLIKMVQNYVKKREPHNKEDMLNAIKAVESGETGYEKAASIFNVKRETLRDQVRKRRRSRRRR